MLPALPSNASKTNYDYMNKEEIDKDLLCSMCRNPLIDPVSTKCQPDPHTFCRLCIENYLKVDSNCTFSSCDQTICCENVTLVKSQSLHSKLDALLVKCLGCDESGFKRVDFNAHYNETCSKINIPCQWRDIGCSWRRPKDKLEEHLKYCPFDHFWEFLNTGLRGHVGQRNGSLIPQNNQIKTLPIKKTFFELMRKQDHPIKESSIANRLLNDKENRQQAGASVETVTERELAEDNFLKLMANKMDRYRIQLESKTEECDAYRSQLESKTKEGKKYQDEFASKTKECKEYQGELTSKTKECEKYQDEFASKTKEFKENQSQLALKTEECDAYRSQLESKTKECKEYQSQLALKTEDCNEYRSQLESKTEDCDEYRSQLDSKTKECDELEKQKKALQEENILQMIELQQMIMDSSKYSQSNHVSDETEVIDRPRYNRDMFVRISLDSSTVCL